MKRIGRYCSALFTIGAIAAAGGILHIATYASVIQALAKVAVGGLSPSASKGSEDFWRLASSATIGIPVLVRLTIAIGAISLVFGVVFMGLDLCGCVVLRHGPCQNASGAGKSYRGNAKRGFALDASAKHQGLAWWRRWMAMEETVLALERNTARIRLSISVFLALLWSPIAIELSIAGLTGQCRMAVRSAHPESHPEIGVSAEHVCGLLRKGLVGVTLTWLCWTVLAVVLVVLNTHSKRSQSKCYNASIYHHNHANIPLSIIPGNCDGTMGILPSSVGAKNAQNAHNPPQQAHQMFQSRLANGAGYRKAAAETAAANVMSRPQSGTYTRSSLSNFDEESFMAGASRGSIQSLIHAKNKTSFYLQPHSLLHHPGHRQLYGANQLQFPADASQEKMPKQQRRQSTYNLCQMMHKKRVSSMLYGSANSSSSAIAEESLFSIDMSTVDEDSDNGDSPKENAEAEPGVADVAAFAGNSQQKPQAARLSSLSLEVPAESDRAGVPVRCHSKGSPGFLSARSSKRNTIG